MPTFQYIAKDRTGHALTGTVEGASDTEAAELLHNKELIVISITQSTKKEKAKAKGVKGGKVKLDDLVVFSRQLATMIDAGIPLVQALGILGEQIENLTLRNIVNTVRQDIEAGMSFCDALAKHNSVFSDLFINMTRAGEASGMLDDVLDRLAGYLEKSAALQRKVKSSMVYPAVVVSMAFIITVFLMVKVVPTFKGIFDSLGGQLPLPTLILITISDFMTRFFLVGVAMLVVGIIFLKKYIATPKGRYQFDKYQLKVPVLGELMTKVGIAKFSRTFSTLIKSGVSVLNALDIVAKTSGNKLVEEAINNARTAVKEGEPIARPLAKSGVFPPMVCRMIGVGEQTGQLEKMLSKIADFYDEQVDAAVSALTSLMEPMIIAVLGVVIGGIVIALFLPIFKMTQLISG